MLKLTKDIESKIATLCVKHQVSDLYLFGSALTENFNVDSDLDLAVIELNSGLGQANLLQKALNAAVDNYGESRVDKFLFDEWVYDLAQAGFMFHKARHDS